MPALIVRRLVATHAERDPSSGTVGLTIAETFLMHVDRVIE